MWKYDKRSRNNAPFVYFSTELITNYINNDIQKIMNYSINVLNALKVKYGPSHLEIKMVPNRGPILI